MPEIDVPFRARPASDAWSRPSSEREKSNWPCQTPLAFAVDWPWRIRRTSCLPACPGLSRSVLTERKGNAWGRLPANRSLAQPPMLEFSRLLGKMRRGCAYVLEASRTRGVRGEDEGLRPA